MVNDRDEVVVGGRILEDGLVPVLEVRVVRNQVREGLPLVCGGDETGPVGADGGGLRIGGLEGILRPREGGVGGWVKRGSREGGGVGLNEQ